MKKIVFKFIGLSVLVGSVASAWLMMEYQRFANTPVFAPAAGFRYELKPGTNLKMVARDLADAQLITNPTYLVWLARVTGKADHIQTGEYLLTNDLTPVTFLDKINTGATIQYGLTIVEGWTFQQMLDEIKHNENLMHTLYGLSDKEIMTKLNLVGQHPEGQFLPDTYNFPRGTTDLAFLQRANKSMQDYISQQWEIRDAELPYKSPYEALIMASIVEKETGVEYERPQIAGVFIRRLRKRMRLQTDPTVIYGIGKAYTGNIQRKHLKQDTPYNTYTRFGLPPTPIALPGKDAIYAALHPADGDDLYFVAKGDGSHVFNSTLNAHNNDVIKYQLKGKRRKFSSSK